MLATTQAEIIDNLFEDLEEVAPDDGDGITNWLDRLQTSGSTIGTVATTEQSARPGRNSANTTALNNLKTVLATERSAAEAAADRLYRNTEQSAWNTYLTSVQSANTTYLSSIKTAENTYKTAVDTADSAFDTTTITAYTNYHQTIRALDTAFYAAVSDATDPTFTTTTYFNTAGANTNLPFQKTTVENTSKAVDHEDCPYCHGKGTKTVPTGGMGMVGLVWTGEPTSTVPCICAEKYFSPENFARTYITNKKFHVFDSDNWGFLDHEEKDFVYAMGCIGISIVSLGVTDLSTTSILNIPHSRLDAHLTLSYDEARNFYLECRNQGSSPALLMMVNKGDLRVNPQNTSPWLYRNDEKISVIIPFGSYDYRILANIDIGNGNQACWLRAVSGWKDPKDVDKKMVIVTPVIHGLGRVHIIIIEKRFVCR